MGGAEKQKMKPQQKQIKDDHRSLVNRKEFSVDPPTDPSGYLSFDESHRISGTLLSTFPVELYNYKESMIKIIFSR